MAYRKVAEENLTAIADAIRAKSGGSDGLVFPDGFLAALESIEAGGACNVLFDVLEYTPIGPGQDLKIYSLKFIPDILVILSGLTGSSDSVGLAVHIKKDDGTIYQEKWRYQSTKYLVGISVTDGSLFNVYGLSDYTVIEISDNDTSYGIIFSASKKHILAAKYNRGVDV